MPNSSTRQFTAVAIPGPAHHQLAIGEALLAHCTSPAMAVNAFTLADHAITAAWPLGPAAIFGLTFTQFHELAVQREFAEVVRLALVVDADFDRIDEIASALQVALLGDTDLQGRQPSA
ncbi:hypothetical protein [Kitasatospora cineracea]|uniref:hypothetical protein n=1 Tax=Kitasatospora cineracea TaxID=88074 RepID=UPI0033EF8B8B